MTREEFANKMFLIDLKEEMYDDDPSIQTWNDLPPEDQQSYLNEAQVYMKLPEEEWVDFAFYGV